MPSEVKLFYAPGACSLASHIALEETGAAYTSMALDLKAGDHHKPDYLRLNPKGRVPTLVVDDWALTENPAILHYVARAWPEARLWPEDLRAGARVSEWMAWIASTVHIAYAHIRRAERYATSEAALEDVRAKAVTTARDLWLAVDERLGDGPWAAGDRYSVADPYLLVFWTWGRGPTLNYDMAADCPNWTAHARRMAERPAVRQVFAREGIALPA